MFNRKNEQGKGHRDKNIQIMEGKQQKQRSVNGERKYSVEGNGEKRVSIMIHYVLVQIAYDECGGYSWQQLLIKFIKIRKAIILQSRFSEESSRCSNASERKSFFCLFCCLRSLHPLILSLFPLNSEPAPFHLCDTSSNIIPSSGIS